MLQSDVRHQSVIPSAKLAADPGVGSLRQLFTSGFMYGDSARLPFNDFYKPIVTGDQKPHSRIE